jgi:ATP-dependent Clp protease protease subunit
MRVSAAMTQTSDPTRYPLLANPHIRLSGTVDQLMYENFRAQLGNCPKEGTLVIALTTLGGDPEVARTMADDIRLLEDHDGREILFLGKVAVYSAGATFMSAFPVARRFLTRHTRLMLHERQITKQIDLNGPLRMVVSSIKAALHEVEHSIEIEEEGFHAIVRDSQVSFEELRQKAPSNWYIEAEEARDRGLVLDVI